MSTELKLEKIKRKASTDLFFFCKKILGYDLMTTKTHQELCDFVCEDGKGKKLILMPRGSFKSSVVTIGDTLWRLVRNPNLRVLISSETFNQSKSFLKAIKSHIETNKTFRSIFGDFKKDDNAWRQDEITVQGRTLVAREPSISVSGIGQVKVGLHFDHIILDDPVSEKNINTPEQVEKVIKHYKLLLSILEPGGSLIIIGTRWHYSDLYGHLIENEKKTFDIHKRSAKTTTGKLFFPERLTEDYLDEQRQAQGSYVFSCQYMNEPVDQDSAEFKKSWIQYYKLETCPIAVNHFICVDPASSLDKNADYTAIIVAAVSSKDDIFIKEAIQVRKTIYDVLNILFELVKRYNVHEEGVVGLELNAMQKTLKYIFTEEMNKRGFFFPIKELRGDNVRTKYKRIRGLQPYFENGKIYLLAEQKDLIDQIVRYPRVKHDDLIDALAYILQIKHPADVPKEDKWEKSELSSNEIQLWKYRDDIAKKRVVRRTKVRY